ncbi:hypothetical protein HYH03_002664 [Edaphochlamys debaryana]|uniref:Uncharacterized protein n=1 Tax=Edaphochlamys debaryana TaxID=47281 RepID=A0A835YF36_9CHLO|nr:hypothetical protein HYH03_002664 [Edaphochlamys debaryana]|eukprot:KAG2499731.1 hypothetical protein HYH03_002664 [Edaphochlamys debaryana]
MGRGSSVNGVRRESTDTDGSEPMRSRQTSRQGMLEPLPEAVTPTASLPGSMAGDALLKPTGPPGEAQQQPDTRGGDQTAQAARPSGGGGVPGRHDSNEALMKLLLPTDAKQGQTADARAPQIQA